jgi:hypothetical protein
MKKTLLLLLLLISFKNYSQTVSCDDLLQFIKSKGTYVASISSYTMDSEWLHEVTAYSYDGKYYVIAKIKKDKYSYSTNTYIFCGIPYRNWSDFKNGSYGDSESYGSRFHKYIMDYACNCD